MPTVTITLSERQKAFAEAHVRAAKFGSIGEYLGFLIHLEQLKKNRARIDALLQEGLDSGPATPMTDQDWREIRAEVFGNGAKRKRQLSKRPRKK